MESVCVRCLRTSWSSTDTNQQVRKYCTHTLSMVYYVYYIHTFLFNDKLCCTDSSQKLMKDVSYIRLNVLTVDIC